MLAGIFQTNRDMNIKYKRTSCIGCGICSAEASHIWEMSNVDGKADMLDSSLKKDYYLRVLWPDENEKMRNIVSLCPTKAIQLI